jgi:hypothetical protein
MKKTRIIKLATSIGAIATISAGTAIGVSSCSMAEKEAPIKYITAIVTQNNLVAGNSASAATITVTSHGDIDLSKLVVNPGSSGLLAGPINGNTFPLTCGTAAPALYTVSITSSEDGVGPCETTVTVASQSTKYFTAIISENGLVAGSPNSTATLTITTYGGINLDKLSVNVGETGLIAGQRNGSTFPLTCGTAKSGLLTISVESTEDGVPPCNTTVTVISSSVKYLTATISENNLVAGNTSSEAVITVTPYGDIADDTLSLDVGSTGFAVGQRTN